MGTRSPNVDKFKYTRINVGGYSPAPPPPKRAASATQALCVAVKCPKIAQIWQMGVP